MDLELRSVGAQHPKVKQVQAVRKNSAPNPRRLFLAEGLWANNLLLSKNIAIDTFFWCPEAAYGDEARKRASELAGRARNAYQVSERTLARISERDKPDGLLSLAELPTWSADQLRFDRTALIMVADGMEIPGNLGTLLRTLDACQADCLVLTNRRTRLSHPKVFRASQGMVLTVPVVEFDSPEQTITWLKRNHFDVYLADTHDAKNYRQCSYDDRRVAFVLGAEKYGLAKPWQEAGFRRVFIPMLGSIDSLNVSISAAVLLFEARAQQNEW